MSSVPPSWPNGRPGHCPIAIVGEAPGQDEVWEGRPFVGASGQELDRMLAEVGINRSQCLLTNVISQRPPDNNLTAFCARKEDLSRDYPLHIGPMVTHGGNFYLRPELLGEGLRLREELAAARPNVVIALGATACWALLGDTAIGNLRGVVHRSTTSRLYKVLPTYHPAAVLRQWKWRPIVCSDLAKAKRESSSPNFNYDPFEIWIEPELADLYEFERRFIPPNSLVAPDIETANGEITCIGFGVGGPGEVRRGLVIPFRTDPVTMGKGESRRTFYTGNYWPDFAQERAAWHWVRHILERRPDVELIWQNGLYDIQYLLAMGIRPRNTRHDTMILHHSRHPEMDKSLGFMGSIYLNTHSWKSFGGKRGAKFADDMKRDA